MIVIRMVVLEAHYETDEAGESKIVTDRGLASQTAILEGGDESIAPMLPLLEVRAASMGRAAAEDIRCHLAAEEPA